MIRESELGRSTTRANLVEEALCKLKKTSLEIAKRGVASDIKRNQNEMKERLHRYRKRQKDIFKSKIALEHKGEAVDEFQIASQMLNRNTTRPKTCPPGSVRHATTAAKPEPEIELDPLFYGDQQKSKIDLRPRTAVNVNGDRQALNKLAPKGRLGSQILQTRYFDDDELEQRYDIYNHFLRMRKGNELERFDSLITPRVGEFCSHENFTEADAKRRLDQNSILRSRSELVYKHFNKQPMFTPRTDTNVSRTGVTSGFGKMNNRHNKNQLASRNSILRATTAPSSNLKRTLSERAKGQLVKSASRNNFLLRAQ